MCDLVPHTRIDFAEVAVAYLGAGSGRWHTHPTAVAI